MKLLSLLLILLITTNCDSNYSAEYPYNQPVEINDGLNTGTLSRVSMDYEIISKAVGRIDKGKYGEIHSMLVYKNDRLVLEEYFSGHQYQWDAPGHFGEYVSWNKDMPHCIHSDTKSIVSLCIGIAVDKGFIKDINQSIFDYLPDYQYLNKNNREYVTIEHLLTMTSGFRWEEWGKSLGSVENDQIGMWFWEEGPNIYVLKRELLAVPGTRFNYSGGDIQLLAEILQNATGMSLDKFSEKYLFEPLGITSFDWWLIFRSGEIQAAGGLKLTPRDMIKIGALMLNNGKWNGKQIISEAWLSKCSSPFAGNTRIKIPGEDLGKLGYSYTWWTKTFDYKNQTINMFLAVGWGGQKIMVLPELDMVVAFTGANYDSKVHNFKILEKFIIPSIKQNI